MRVVVVDERASERGAMVRALQQASFIVEPFADAKGALAVVARDAPQVIVCAAPPAGITEVVRLLRGADASGQAYVIAVLDGTPGGREVSTALAAGAHDFVRRPVSDVELVERVKGPMRMLKWARSVTQTSVFDFSTATDLRRLRAWQTLGPLVTEDLTQLTGEPLEAARGWPELLEGTTRGATIAMSLPAEQTEMRLSIVVDARSAAWLAGALLGDPRADETAIDDVLRELANTAGGAVKRAALPENVTLTTGLPTNDGAPRIRGEGVQCWTAIAPGGKACVAIVGEVRQLENQRVPASQLREGMVLVHDIRSESGSLLVTAGSRLTGTTAQRLSNVLGARFVVEVAYAA